MKRRKMKKRRRMKCNHSAFCTRLGQPASRGLVINFQRRAGEEFTGKNDWIALDWIGSVCSPLHRIELTSSAQASLISLGRS